MYYLQDVKMETIARHLGTSRSTVSRMIKAARETGLVEINLRPTHSRAPGIRQYLRERWGVEAFVVPVLDSTSHEARLDQVALTCARLLASWLQSEMVLSIAWGTTTSAIARHLPAKPIHGAIVVQLNGAANTRTSGVAYAGDLLAAFADAFDAHSVYFPVPAFFDYEETKDAMWRERSVRRVLDVQAQTDIALFSVGATTGRSPPTSTPPATSNPKTSQSSTPKASSAMSAPSSSEQTEPTPISPSTAEQPAPHPTNSQPSHAEYAQ